MEHKETHNETKKKNDILIPVSIVLASALVAFSIVYKTGAKDARGNKNAGENVEVSKLSASLIEAVIPQKGTALPVQWGALGKELVSAKVIDQGKFETLYAERGGLTAEMKSYLEGEKNDQMIINRENAPYLLNLFWALGLGTKNKILETGPMMDSRYGGAGNFASTGGWTLAAGSAMDHYSQHSFITLTNEQQAMVERVAKNIYRPCCGNATYFPDCNHGMAMLGLLELMASQGVSEADMYAAALKVNAYWFPDTYITIASYFASQGTPWANVDPRVVLSAEYSSAAGYRAVQAKVAPIAPRGGNGCGV